MGQSLQLVPRQRGRSIVAGGDDYAVAITFPPGQPPPISLLTLKLAQQDMGIVIGPVPDVGGGGRQGGMCDLAHSHLGVLRSGGHFNNGSPILTEAEDRDHDQTARGGPAVRWPPS